MKYLAVLIIGLAVSACNIKPNFTLLLTPSAQEVTLGNSFTVTADVVSDEVTCATFSHDNNAAISDTISQGSLTTIYEFTPTQTGEFTVNINACNSCDSVPDGAICVSDRVTVTVVQ